jgi:hypothetical protein
MATYDHIQKSSLWLIFIFPAAILVGIVSFLPHERSVMTVWFSVTAVAVGLFLFVVLTFRHLRVRDTGDFLSVRFGPIPLFGRRIPYARMVGVEAARSSFLDGWGIHYMPGKGWIYNLWGFDCVAVHLRLADEENKSEQNVCFRIGTDDVQGLVEFLKGKVGQA